MTLVWPSGGTRRLQQDFAAAGFGLLEWWLEEFAAYGGEDSTTFIHRHCEIADRRASREIPHGFIGPNSDAAFGSSLASFNRTLSLDFLPENTRAQIVKAMKLKEADHFGIDPDIQFTRRRDFADYAVAASESCGFRTMKIKDVDRVGPTMARTLDNGSVVTFYFTPPRSWNHSSSHQTFCQILLARSSDRIASTWIDALAPGLGRYRLYDDWRECALSALALARIHRCFADLLA